MSTSDLESQCELRERVGRKFFRKLGAPREIRVIGCVWLLQSNEGEGEGEVEGGREGEGEKEKESESVSDELKLVMRMSKYEGDVHMDDFKPYMEKNTRYGYIYCVTPVSRLSSGHDAGGTFTLKVLSQLYDFEFALSIFSLKCFPLFLSLSHTHQVEVC